MYRNDGSLFKLVQSTKIGDNWHNVLALILDFVNGKSIKHYDKF